MKRIIAGCLLLAFQFSCYLVFANNVCIDGTVKVVEVNSGVATLEFDLSWENSWRDSYNWDAVWVFLKYKNGVSGDWTHVNLDASGHMFSPSSFDAMIGKNTDNAVKGLFVYRTTESTGNVSVTCRLKWTLPSGLTKASFDNHNAFITAHGVEMVYVPYGANIVGDGLSNHCFTVGDSSNVIIDSEDALSLGVRNGSSVSVPASYPKGYQGFYAMKYEVSQDQYVRFLNQLTRAQQEELLGASKLSGLVAGDYIFGSKSGVSNRNGIILSRNPGPGKPLIFGHRFNDNDNYTDDGQCIACNYMGIRDLLAYSAWSGLRPMSELEYERACRRPYPGIPFRGEYAWNESVGLSASGGLMSDGLETESVSGGNANCGGSQSGPLRCGVFATPGSNQPASGGTFWGVMEMSGNVKELCGNVSNTSLSRTVNGSGAYATNLWGVTVSQFGLRGGGFTSPDSLLRVSDRTEIASLSNLDGRDSTVGFRLVRTLDAGSVTVDAGELNPITSLCPGIATTITEKTAASVTPSSGMMLTYIWSVKVGNGTFTVIKDQAGEELTYNNFAENTAYQFNRKVVCSLGEAETAPVSYTIPVLSMTVTPESGHLGKCNVTIFTASGASSYSWKSDGMERSVTETYIPSYSSLGNSGRDLTVTCVGQIAGCPVTKSIALTVAPNTPFVQTFRNCGDKLKDICGNAYDTKMMADGRCWMVEDLRTGSCNATDFATYYTGSIQHRLGPDLLGVCIASTQPGAGYLYNWQAAMQSADAVYNTAGNPSGNINGNSPTQWRGICPDGWHLPSGGSTGEFQELYTALGNNGSKIYPGMDAVGWRGVMGGYAQGSSVNYVGSYGLYWCSTYYDTSNANDFYFIGSAVNPQDYSYKYRGFSVRCVKDY